jgi:hypothetical protein
MSVCRFDRISHNDGAASQGLETEKPTNHHDRVFYTFDERWVMCHAAEPGGKKPTTSLDLEREAKRLREIKQHNNITQRPLSPSLVTSDS